MCLQTSQLIPYTAGGDLTVYRIALKRNNNTYASPFRYEKIVIGETYEIPSHNKRTYSNYNYGNKLSVGGGYYHSLIDVKNYPNYNPDTHIILEAEIPSGSQYYVSGDLVSICSDKIKIVREVPEDQIKEVNLNSILAPATTLPEGLNSISKSGDDINISVTVKNDKDEDEEKTFILLTSALSKQEPTNTSNGTKEWCKATSENQEKINSFISNEDEEKRIIQITSYDKAKKYFDGKNDTNKMKEDITDEFYALKTAIDASGYLPSSGELSSVLKYQFYINVELAKGGSKTRIKDNNFWTSTFYNSRKLYSFNTNYLALNTLDKGKLAFTLPFKQVDK